VDTKNDAAIVHGMKYSTFQAVVRNSKNFVGVMLRRPYLFILPMQPRIHKDKPKHNPTTCYPCQNIREPLVVPGKFPREPVNDKRQHESNRAGEKQ
jgi:hypothetical protein